MKGYIIFYALRGQDQAREGIEVLTGVKAGDRLSDGTYEEGTVNYIVQKRLSEKAELIKEYMK